jgi:hypothetical protein
MKTINFTNHNGRRFMARLLIYGDSYGLNNCLVWNKEDRPFGVGVEFYDLGSKHSSIFVSRYFLSTLQERDWRESAGLVLHGTRPDIWTITAQNVIDVISAFSSVVEGGKQ